MASDDDVEALRVAVANLTDRFDTVQVFATRSTMDDGGTVNVNWGHGNWFARFGQVKWWIDHQEFSHQREEGSDL